jgi:hypothetical protein
MKQYKKFVSFGCSFTEGHHLADDKVAWGDSLASKLDIPHINCGEGGSSNEQIFNKIVSTIENPNFSHSDILVGIQLSEVMRFQLWCSRTKSYWSSHLEHFIHDWEDIDEWGMDKHIFKFARKHKEAITSLYGETQEHVYNTVKGLVMITSYLKSKGIDFFVFEGMNSFLDKGLENDFPKFLEDGITKLESPPHFIPFVEEDFKKSLYNSKWFYTERGAMNYDMWEHPLYDGKENDEHPNPAFANDWSNSLIKWLESKWSME